MRNRFHSLCPYFAMFPEAFVEKHLAATKFDGWVFDPFCGRGTTVLESLIQDRRAAGCDIHPVAFCVAGAKSEPPAKDALLARLNDLRDRFEPPDTPEFGPEFAAFFAACFAEETLQQILFLRTALNWRGDRVDRMLAAICLGALHGESHRSPNYFSNRMPRTISTKPGYSVRWWRERGYKPPKRDVFAILGRMIEYRYRSATPNTDGIIKLSDARLAGDTFPELTGQVTDVITSPPYLDTTNYNEDQWLRLWFLGGKAECRFGRGDGRHYGVQNYWAFLEQAWKGLAPLLAERARFVIRIGGRRLEKPTISLGLENTLRNGTERHVSLVDGGITSPIKHTQASSFRGIRPTPTVEHDFCFLVEA